MKWQLWPCVRRWKLVSKYTQASADQMGICSWVPCFLCRMLVISMHWHFVKLFGLLWITGLDPHHTWAKLAHRDQMFWTCGSVNRIVWTEVLGVLMMLLEVKAVQIETSFIILAEKWNSPLRYSHYVASSLLSISSHYHCPIYCYLCIYPPPHVKALSLFQLLLYDSQQYS